MLDNVVNDRKRSGLASDGLTDAPTPRKGGREGGRKGEVEREREREGIVKRE